VLGGELLALLRLAHPGTVLGGELLARHLGTCRGGELLALVPFSTSASKIYRQVLDSDITDTDLKAAAATCVFGDVITPFRVVTEYTLRNLVNRQQGP
jgi:hypothetical protein